MDKIIEERKRLAWHSRRGMLELDLILVPFAQKQLATLSWQQLQQYKALLAQEDQDLFVWLTQREVAPEAELQAMVDFILSRRSRTIDSSQC